MFGLGGKNKKPKTRYAPGERPLGGTRPIVKPNSKPKTSGTKTKSKGNTQKKPSVKAQTRGSTTNKKKR
jgi:hypothetical protein